MLTRNDLYEQISELITVGNVAVQHLGKTRNELLNEVVVLSGGPSSAGLTRNELLTLVLEYIQA